jgi:hypothetical protein
MAQLQIVCPLRSGTQERWRRLAQEVAGSRREQFEAFCRQAGIIQVQVWVVQLQRGELLLMTLHMQEPQQTLLELATSARPFDRWLREQFQLLLGWNLQEVLPGQHHDLIFTWSSVSADPS